MEYAVPASILGFAVVAFVVGRWWALLLPLVGVPTFYLGLDQRWWGYGLGDFWQVAMILWLAVGIGAVAMGVCARWLQRRR